MSLSGHVHHFALVISIYDLVIFIDETDYPLISPKSCHFDPFFC
jgi:hypothetical protein